MEEMDHQQKKGTPERWKRIVTVDLFSQGNKGERSCSIVSYMIFIMLIAPMAYYILPKEIGGNKETLLAISLGILIWMASFFNVFTIYKKSKILFTLLYLFPICGVVISWMLR